MTDKEKIKRTGYRNIFGLIWLIIKQSRKCNKNGIQVSFEIKLPIKLF